MLRYSQVQELEVTILRGICVCLLLFNQKTETTVLNATTERRGGQRFLLHIITYTKKSLSKGLVDQSFDTLKTRLARINIHTTKHCFAKELLKSQDGGSGTTERLCEDWIFR